MSRRRLLVGLVAVVASACSPATRERLTTSIEPLCDPPSQSLILLAQTVQDATQLPCIAGFPAGWSYGGEDFRSGSATYWLTSAIVGQRAIEVQLLPSCDREGEPFTPEVPTGVAGYVTTEPDGETRRFVFDGGCITQRIAVPASDRSLLVEARETLGFVDRAGLARRLEADDDVTLCGAGAAPCIG
jgi:hypothetical protein